MYALLRAIAGIALRWFYRDIRIEGLERIPARRPLLLVVNHPNALVDALLVGWVVPRRVLITAKSTLFKNPLANLLLRSLGVLPLQRASDLPAAGGRVDPLRNRDTFRAVLAALGRGGAVLIFPEGKSHDEPALAPLKTGAARIAMQARDEGAAQRGSELSQLAILPIGLTFERKDAPRSRVLVQVGEPIVAAGWQPQSGATAVDELTGAIDARLRALTANYSTADDAARAAHLASIVAAACRTTSNASRARPSLAVEAGIARRVDEIAARLGNADVATRAQAMELARRLDGVHSLAAANGIALEDAAVSLESSDGVRFAVREGGLLLAGGPVALWGRINHWLPFRAARAVAMRSVESAADPAMRTIVAGVAFVLLCYAVQTIVVGVAFGWIAATGYLISLPVAAEINFRLSDRVRRSRQRARAFLIFRRLPELQRRLSAELTALQEDVAAFDAAFTRADAAESGYGVPAGGGR
ncbi:MAG TPA: lysophospholipid acyltransferase family protein [Gemmatimonadaceae bacterium]|nr:lysophospholipid acyltransferase family protein [Gemmatimonadaceae bacterium]